MITTAIPDISDLIDQHLELKRIAEGAREITGGMTWRASKLGYCLRQQYLEFFLKKPKITDFDAKALKRFEVGHAWSRQFAQWFRDMGYEVQEELELFDRVLDIGAHADFIVTGPSKRAPGNLSALHLPNVTFGVELKSVNSKTFWYRTKMKEESAAPEHMIQAAVYSILRPEIEWIVLTVSKDDLTIEQDLVTQSHRESALGRLHLLNKAKTLSVLPPCTCKDDWQWQYCGYWPDVEAREEWLKLTPAQRKATGKPEGECCGI